LKTVDLSRAKLKRLLGKRKKLTIYIAAALALSTAEDLAVADVRIVLRYWISAAGE
jgi:hypothetical protein